MLDYQGHNDDAPDAAFGGETGVMSGLIEGTKVATALGWQRVENVRAGDRVLTFDNGLQPVRAIRRVSLWTGEGHVPRRFRPLHVPAGVLGNTDDMVVLPRQGLMVESDAAEAAIGDPFPLVRAEALDGVCGIRRMHAASPFDVFVMQFEDDEIVFTAHGALCVCAAAGDMLQRLFHAAETIEYRLLSDDTDADLISRIRHEIAEAVMAGDDRIEATQARVA